MTAPSLSPSPSPALTGDDHPLTSLAGATPSDRESWGRNWALTAFFTLCLVPLSVDGNGVNYAFLLLPLAAVITGIGSRRPPKAYLLLMAIYTAIGALAAIYQQDLADHVARRLTSFVLFLSMFAFVFIRIDEVTIAAFCKAVVAVSLFFSLMSVLNFFALGGSEFGFDAKDAVGGQRYGFIYLLAFWLLCLWAPNTSAMRLFRPLAIFVVLVGLLMTFSRASLMALGASCLLFGFMAVAVARRSSFGALLRRAAVAAVAIATAGALLAWLFPVIFDFFDVRLIEFLANRDSVRGNLEDVETSEGTRIFVWGEILDYVTRNPFTGAGYLGVWVLRLFDGFSGSAHNQYLDVLFRVGLVGFAIYVVLLWRIGARLRRRWPGLFWGFVGMLVYGLFHETFKESHGGFVLAFFVGLLSQTRAKTTSRE